MRIKIKHSETCSIVNTKRELYVFGESYFGNKAGNRKKIGNWNYWLPMRCNDPDCPAIILLDDYEVTKFIKTELSTKEEL